MRDTKNFIDTKNKRHKILSKNMKKNSNRAHARARNHRLYIYWMNNFLNIRDTKNFIETKNDLHKILRENMK